MVEDAPEQFPDAADWERVTGVYGRPSEASTMYRMRLNGPPPDMLISTPGQALPPNIERGRDILNGLWRFGSTTLDVSKGHAPWGPPFPSLHFADRVHRFHWLRDVIAADKSTDDSAARGLIVSWTDHFGRWDPFAWRVDVTADRVINWLSHGAVALTPLDQPARGIVLDSLARQVRHLALSQNEFVSLEGQFLRAVALAMAGACLPDGEKELDLGMSILERELQSQILPDGGHISRSPAQLAKILALLNALEDTLLRLGRAAPDFLTRCENRIQNMLKFLSVADGGLIVANGGEDGKSGLAQAALSPFGEEGGRFAFAQLTGFQRIVADQLTVHVDVGEPPKGPAGIGSGAGCLSINVQDGPDRIITQIGGHDDLEPDWKAVVRKTAAHSTLQIADEDISVSTEDSETEIETFTGIPNVSARRLEEGDQYLLEAQHGGWRDRYGLIHRRRLFVQKDGHRITGEDSLSRPLSALEPVEDSSVPFSIRFQLHPDVQVAEGQNDRTILLGLPERQRVWRFRADLPIKVIESVYCAGARKRPAPQLLIAGLADPTGDGSVSPNRVRWALTLVEFGV